MAELIREFLEFYRLDYTLAIFKPETNIKGDIDRDGLAQRAGFENGIADGKPILLQLLESFMAGERGAAPMKGAAAFSDPIKIEAPGIMKN